METKRLGVMLDCSRGGVYTEDAVKKFIDALSRMGYNYIQLYTEDVYAVDGEPKFGYFRGRYTEDELRRLDEYAAERGMELVPCIQTLAHLMGITRWSEYWEICDHGNILLADADRTYELIENMFKTCARVFKSRRINIGMDEAHMVGLGKYLDKHGYKNRHEILNAHLKRVCELAVKYGFEPMMWSDMFFRLANHDVYKVDKDFVMPESVTAAVPREVKLVYWDYYTSDYDDYVTQFKAHKAFDNDTVFACGAWCWAGFVPHNKWSIAINRTAFKACEACGINDIFVTCWKDDGAESSLFSVLPTLYAAAENFRGNYDEKEIKRGFEKTFGIAFDDFLSLDAPDLLDCELTMNNPTKYMLYSDPFLGYLDFTVDESKAGRFAEAKKRLDKLVGNAEYGYMFKTISALCDVLDIKYTLGVRTRRVYLGKDKNALAALIADYKTVERRVKNLYKAFEAQWDRECKLNGFEHHDVRLGGLMRRLKHCRAVLQKYYDGETRSIPALEEPVLPTSASAKPHATQYGNNWLRNALIKHIDGYYV